MPQHRNPNPAMCCRAPAHAWPSRKAATRRQWTRFANVFRTEPTYRLPAQMFWRFTTQSAIIPTEPRRVCGIAPTNTPPTMPQTAMSRTTIPRTIPLDYSAKWNSTMKGPPVRTFILSFCGLWVAFAATSTAAESSQSRPNILIVLRTIKVTPIWVVTAAQGTPRRGWIGSPNKVRSLPHSMRKPFAGRRVRLC